MDSSMVAPDLCQGELFAVPRFDPLSPRVQSLSPGLLALSYKHNTPIDTLCRERYALTGDRERGVIALDPASSAEVNARTVRAARILTIEDNGLSQPWDAETLHLNPPGMVANPGRNAKLDDRARAEIEELRRVQQEQWALCKRQPWYRDTQSFTALWWHKLEWHWHRGDVEHAIFVGFSAEIVRTCQSVLDHWVCFPRKRLAFLGADFEPQRSPTKSNVIACLTRSSLVAARFAEAFEPLGRVGRLRSPEVPDA